MAKIPPFHSIIQKIYHDDTTCPDAHTMQVDHKRQGMAGKLKCLFCQKLGTSANGVKEISQCYQSLLSTKDESQVFYLEKSVGNSIYF